MKWLFFNVNLIEATNMLINVGINGGISINSSTRKKKNDAKKRSILVVDKVANKVANKVAKRVAKKIE